MTLRELDLVRLLRDLPERDLVRGAEGMVMHVYGDGEAVEVEFGTMEERNIRLAPISSADLEFVPEKPDPSYTNALDNVEAGVIRIIASMPARSGTFTYRVPPTRSIARMRQAYQLA